MHTRGWTRGVQVKLWDPLRTRTIRERQLEVRSRQSAIQIYVYLTSIFIFYLVFLPVKHLRPVISHRTAWPSHDHAELLMRQHTSRISQWCFVTPAPTIGGERHCVFRLSVCFPSVTLIFCDAIYSEEYFDESWLKYSWYKRTLL